MDYCLYVILGSDTTGGRPLLEVAQAAVRGGATVLQLREKKVSSRAYLHSAQTLVEWCRRAGTPLIVNDRVDIALAVDADGVHLGDEDLPIQTARRLLGPRKIIGLSAGTVAEAHAAQQLGADYIGVGAVFSTASKADAGAPIGVAALAEIVRAVSIPVIAIGGIGLENVGEVMAAGAAGAAVISAVAGASDVEGAARALRERIDRARAKIRT